MKATIELLRRTPWGHVGGTASVLICILSFALHVDTWIDLKQDTARPNINSSTPLHPRPWTGSCSSQRDMPALQWQQLERDHGSKIAALFSDVTDFTDADMRYLLLLVHSMQGMGYSVIVYYAPGASITNREQMMEQGELLGVGLESDRLRLRPWRTPAPKVRMFIYSSRNLHAQLPGIGQVNVFHHANPPLGDSSSPLHGQQQQEGTAVLGYDYVLFSSQEGYDSGMQQLRGSLQLADANALLIPSIEAMPTALSFQQAVQDPHAELLFSSRRHILNVGRDYFESSQALGVFVRMRARRQLPNGTKLVLILSNNHSHPDNVMLSHYIQLHGLSASVEILLHPSLDSARDYHSIKETLVQWHFPGQRAINHTTCTLSVVDGMLRGFIPVTTCGQTHSVINHGVNGFLANSTDDIAHQTTLIFSMPEPQRYRLWNTTVEHAKAFSFEVFRVTMEKLDHRGIASRTFRHLIAKTLPAVRACAMTNVFEEAPNAAVIVEPRIHYALEYVILNTMAVLARSKHPWALHVFYSQENDWLMSRIAKDPRFSKVHLHSLEEMSWRVEAYNSMLKTTAFWDKLGTQTEKVLIFQTDSLLLGESIDEFLDYDYVGAPWHLGNQRWSTITAMVPPGVGNGGLSLRSVQVTKQIIATGTGPVDEQEDLFFARHVYNMNKSRLASREHAYRFGLEVPCSDLDPFLKIDPFSIHAAWYYTPVWRVQQLLEQTFTAVVRPQHSR